MILDSSVLGLLYRWWLGSALYAVNRAVWRRLRPVFSASRVLDALARPGRLSAVWAQSVAARLLGYLTAALVSPFRALARRAPGLFRAIDGSRILRWEFLTGALICVMFLVPHDYWNNFYAALFAAVLLLRWLLRCGAGRQETAGPEALGPGFALFALACVLSMSVTTAPGDSLRMLALFFSAIVLCWLIAVSFDTPAALRSLLGAIYLCLLLVSAMAVAQRALNLVKVDRLLTDVRLNRGVPGRVYGPLDNPNNLSAFLQVFLPLGAAWAGGAEKEWKRLLLTALLALPALALVMTYARAGWMAVMLSAAVYVWCRNKRLLPVMFVLAIAALPLLPQSVLTRLGTIFNARDTSRVHRVALWKGIRDMLRDHWLAGIGLGPETFQNVYPAYAHRFATSGAYHSQMLYMELDMELGFLGFVSFFAMCLKSAGRFSRLRKRASDRTVRLTLAAGLAALAAFAVSGTVEYQWYYPRCMFAFFIFLGVALAATRAAEREETVCQP